MNIRRITTFTFVLAIAALIVGLSACDQLVNLILDLEDMPPEEMPPGPSREIPIGVVLDLTGPYADSYGLPMQRGFEMAREEINNSEQLGGAKITFIIKDDRSENAVEVVNELIDQYGVSVITGIALSTQLEKVIPTVQEKEFVLFSSVSSKPGLSAHSDFIFRAGLTSAVLNPPLVKATHAHEKFGYQKAATIYQEGDAYATSSDEEFRAALAESEVSILITETYQDQGDDTDYSAALTRIMESNPEALFISALGSHIPQIMIQARQLMPSVHIIVPELTRIEVEAADGAAEEVPTAIGWFSMTNTPMNRDFVRNYTEKYGLEPVAWAAQSYATLHILAAAIEKAQSTDAMAIRDALANISDFDTVLGKFSFDENGDAVYDPIILTVKNGEFEAFE